MNINNMAFVVIMVMLFGMTVITVHRFREVLNELEIIKIEIKQIYNDLIFEE